MKIKQIGDIVDSISQTHKFGKEEVIFLNTSDVLEGKILINNFQKVKTLKGQAKKSIKNGDILFSEIRPKNKRFAFVDVLNPEDYVVSTKLMVLRNKSEDVLTDYFYYFLTYEGTLDYLQMRAENRIGSFPQITFDILKPILINIPKISEQKKIASVLKNIDKKIENNNKINLELEIMANTFYHYWFVQFDFPNEKGKPYKSSGGKMIYCEELKREIPKSWKISELRQCLTSNRGVSYSGKDITGGGIPMINLNSFNPNSTYKPEGIKSYSGTYNISKVLKPFDLVMCNTQQTELDPKKDIIGKSFLVPDIFETEIVSSHHVTTINIKSDLLKYYLNNLFNSEYFHRYISGYATGTNILGLNFEGVLSYLTAIPNDELLYKYNSLIENIEKQKSIIIKENQQLTELRDWLLPMLMNGQVTVGNVAASKPLQTHQAINNTFLLPIITRRIKTNLGIGYGEVGIQKTVYNILAIGGVNMNYAFVNHNNGTYSKQLKIDLQANPYLAIDNIKKVFFVKEEKEAEIDTLISQKENKDFVCAVDDVLNIYKNAIINKETYRIELFNTTLKLISDLQSTDFNKIYKGFANWKITNDKKYSTKAERFKKPTAQKMLDFIVSEKLHLKLING
jgi:type I restriction enzyme, S subunit